MRDYFERATSVALVAAAVVIAAALVRREFFPSATPPGARKSEYVKDWREYLADAHIEGDRSAPVTLIEFTDLQCPFCAKYHNTIAALRRAYPTQVAVAYVHDPLPIHSQAVAAARTVECAGAAGKWYEAMDFTFQHQDSLGKRPWTWYARGAGVTDTVSFARCMADSTATPMVLAGAARSAKLDMPPTPTVLLNGWRFATPPQDSQLFRAVADILAGRKPYPGFPSAELQSR